MCQVGIRKFSAPGEEVGEQWHDKNLTVEPRGMDFTVHARARIGIQKGGDGELAGPFSRDVSAQPCARHKNCPALNNSV